MNKRILLIVEGPNDEKSLVEKLWDRFDRGADYSISTYDTNIYVLMNQLFKDGEIDENLDLLRLLKSQDVPEDKRIGKDEVFTDIYLIFDFDPQDPDADFSMLRKTLKFFDDSSERGKLFINYPMMQSFRHITGQEDPDFKERSVPVDIGRGYKSLVDKEAWKVLKQNAGLDRGRLKWIISLNLQKMNYIVNGVYEMPTYDGYKRMTGEIVLDKQLEAAENSNSVYVLNTSVFLIVDYHPSWFFDGVKPGE